jgi:hypothetical protein
LTADTLVPLGRLIPMSALEADLDAAETPVMHDGVEVTDARQATVGDVPLREQLLMWWNFVARTPEEIRAAAADWRAGRFGEVGGYAGEPLAAPPLDLARLIRRRQGN